MGKKTPNGQETFQISKPMLDLAKQSFNQKLAEVFGANVPSFNDDELASNPFVPQDEDQAVYLTELLDEFSDLHDLTQYLDNAANKMFLQNGNAEQKRDVFESGEYQQFLSECYETLKKAGINPKTLDVARENPGVPTVNFVLEDAKKNGKDITITNKVSLKIFAGRATVYEKENKEKAALLEEIHEMSLKPETHEIKSNGIESVTLNKKEMRSAKEAGELRIDSEIFFDFFNKYKDFFGPEDKSRLETQYRAFQSAEERRRKDGDRVPKAGLTDWDVKYYNDLMAKSLGLPEGGNDLLNDAPKPVGSMEKPQDHTASVNAYCDALAGDNKALTFESKVDMLEAYSRAKRMRDARPKPSFWQFITKYRLRKEDEALARMKETLMAKGITEKELSDALTKRANFVVAQGEIAKNGYDFVDKNLGLKRDGVEPSLNLKDISPAIKKASADELLREQIAKAVIDKVAEMQGVDVKKWMENPLVDLSPKAQAKVEDVKVEDEQPVAEDEQAPDEKVEGEIILDGESEISDDGKSAYTDVDALLNTYVPTPEQASEKLTRNFMFGIDTVINDKKLKVPGENAAQMKKNVLNDRIFKADGEVTLTAKEEFDATVAKVYNNLDLKGLDVTKLKEAINAQIDVVVGPQMMGVEELNELGTDDELRFKSKTDAMRDRLAKNAVNGEAEIELGDDFLDRVEADIENKAIEQKKAIEQDRINREIRIAEAAAEKKAEEERIAALNGELDILDKDKDDDLNLSVVAEGDELDLDDDVALDNDAPVAQNAPEADKKAPQKKLDI